MPISKIINTGVTGFDISSNGLVTHPQRPVFAVRGVASGTSLTAAHTNYDYATSWTTTDVDVGGLLNAGGYAQVPTGFGGLYQITWIVNGTTAQDYNCSEVFLYDGSTYTRLWLHFGFNDYTNYSTGTTMIYPLDEGDIIYAGWDDRYGVPHDGNHRCNFCMIFVG